MRNSKKFKFLGKFFFREKTWTVSISLPAVSPLVASPCGPPSTSRVSCARLPVAYHSRKTPATYRRTILSSGCPPTPPPPPANQRVPVLWLTPPRKRSSTSICPFSQSVFIPAARQTVRPPVNNRHLDAAPVCGPSLHEPTRDGHSHRGFIKHRVIPTSFEL